MIQSVKARLVLFGAAALMSASPLCAGKQKITRTESDLLAAGFEAKPANTPERTDMLSRLPKQKFVQRVHGDTVAYVYADAKHCNCIYVGSEKDYGAYRKEAQKQEIADEQLDAAEDYADSQWDWGLWGGWGPHLDGFGFGYGW